MKKVMLLGLCCLYCTLLFGQKKTATITCKLLSPAEGDSVALVTDPYGFPFFPGMKTWYRGVLRQHQITFRIPTDKIPLRFSIRLLKYSKTRELRVFLKLFGGYYLENGDQVTLTESRGELTFSGKGSEKLRLLQEFNDVEDHFTFAPQSNKADGFLRYMRTKDSVAIAKTKLLKAHKPELSPAAYELLRTDITGMYWGRFFGLNGSPAGVIAQIVDSLKDYQPMFRPYLQEDKYPFSDEIRARSASFADGLICEYRYDSCYAVHVPFRLEKAYGFFSKHFTGALRDRLLLHLLYRNKKSAEDFAGLAQNALSIVGTPAIRRSLEILLDGHQTGKPAYNFTLTDTLGKQHQLTEYRNKIVVLDFWYNGCGGCRMMAPKLAAVEKQFRGKPVVFLSINIDKTRDRWLKGIQSGAYTSPDVINLYTEGAEDDHPAVKKFTVSSYPTLILIDNQGNLMRNPQDPRQDNGQDLVALINGGIR